MVYIGNAMVYIIMGCVFVGGIASIIKPDCSLGQQFVEGINSIGGIFLSVAGIFASIPFLSWFIRIIFGRLFSVIGSDPAMAATTLIAVDMGGYQLAEALADTKESWVMAMYTGYMAGATIVFTIPIGLKMIEPEDKRFFAIGTMCGFIAIPIGVFVSSIMTMWMNLPVRESIISTGASTHVLTWSLGLIIRNLIPLIIICILIIIGLWRFPEQMVNGFSVFGRAIDVLARFVLIICIIEHFTGLFSMLTGSWEFEPLMGTDDKALEVVGSVCMMLAGAFPMVYLIQKYLMKKMGKLGKKIGLSENATAGILAACANSVAMFPMIKDMEPKDKAKVVAFSVCGAFLIGDHLSFQANFQPNLIVPLFFGKLIAGMVGVFLAGSLASILE